MTRINTRCTKETATDNYIIEMQIKVPVPCSLSEKSQEELEELVSKNSEKFTQVVGEVFKSEVIRLAKNQ